MEVVISQEVREKLKDMNLQNKYIRIYYCGFGWLAGLQMVFDKNVDDKYEVYEVDGFKVAIEKDLLKQYDYVEIKHSDSFVQRGFYPSILKPEN